MNVRRFSCKIKVKSGVVGVVTRTSPGASFREHATCFLTSLTFPALAQNKCEYNI